MLLKLDSGLKVAISPIFPWELRREELLKVRSDGAFHPDHVTTRLCLRLLDDTLKHAACRSLLDVGCGSGILALAAARLGVPRVVGFDRDIRAVATCLENARANGLLGAVHWFAATPDAVKGRFDCVVANLPYTVLRLILPDLPPLLNPGGHLILSGFHDIQWRPLLEKLIAQGFTLRRQLAGDRSFFGVPPSGSFTWMAVLLAHER
ncbi:50S ribosomal protein L11 methyltransferase [Desulfoferrobacter suflitae]|uniref:50S ribosomal protein L11 methyltransferase n=1 Tax=Desulfoferrobacter suflitae TaxID=2865782 RepID=UPI00216435A8|nr:50S ribosomal protein L11 methyltransferase [Desulfoferrobacter suflitae]MCK8601766.1 50S ribosomal protein L11 methyltransferase [Desulfoferrobacter suflitae]